MRLIYHPDAELELVEAARFYERKVHTLGSQFLDAISRAVEVIQSDPHCCSIIEAEVRRYLQPRFPYAIYYRVLPDEIRVLAFKHHSRDPAYWRYRSS
jgi:toxin ParE1/3/4